jgi:hypothetical protein
MDFESCSMPNHWGRVTDLSGGCLDGEPLDRGDRRTENDDHFRLIWRMEKPSPRSEGFVGGPCWITTVFDK